MSKNSLIDKMDACQDDMEMRIFDLFRERPLSCNLWVLNDKGAGFDFWINDFIFTHCTLHRAMIRVVDKNHSMHKIIDLMGGTYLPLALHAKSLPKRQLLAFNQNDEELSQGLKMWIPSMIMRELKSRPDEKKIIVFTDLTNFVKNEEPGLTEAVTRIYEEAPSCNGAVLTVFKSVEEIERLGEFGKAVIRLSGAVITLRLRPENLEKLKRLGFFVMPSPDISCPEPETE